jgi:transposase-like protein
MATSERDPTREQFWRDAVLGWRTSGLTVRDYCRRQRLAEASFYHWRRELRRRDTTPRPAPPAFVPVTVRPAEPAESVPVEVRCPSGHVVSVPNADAATLRLLFAALAPVPPC